MCPRANVKGDYRQGGVSIAAGRRHAIATKWDEDMNALFVCLLVLLFPVSTIDAESGARDDYGRSRPDGLIIPWQSLLQGNGLEGWGPTASSGAWARDGDAVIGNLDGKRKSHLFQGDSNWKNYENSLFVTLKKGSCMQFPFRVTDDRKGFYFVEFDYAWQSINVTLREPDRHGVTKLSVVNFPLEKGREYHLIISARHRSLTTYIDGKLVNQVTDASYDGGGIGIAMWWDTRAKYRDPKIRHYKWP